MLDVLDHLTSRKLTKYQQNNIKLSGILKLLQENLKFKKKWMKIITDYSL